MIRLLVVDDSAFIRKMLTTILADDKRIEVVGTARDGIDAVKKAKDLKPDIITMDVEMPRMDGIKAVRRIMAENPCPIIMFSSLTREGAQTTLEALQAGAVDFIAKDNSFTLEDKEAITRELAIKIKTIYAERKKIVHNRPLRSEQPATKSTGNHALKPRDVDIIAIGISTGGPLSLQRILPQIPDNLSIPIVVIQHMPPEFTKTLAERLDVRCKNKVSEAAQGDSLRAGNIYIAPGGRHLLVKKSGGHNIFQVSSKDLGKIHRPSVDLFFESVAMYYGKRALGIVMTGMGNDGYEGAKAMKAKGAQIVAQTEESCVVYGMPKAITSANLQDAELSLDEIGQFIIRATNQKVSSSFA